MIGKLCRSWWKQKILQPVIIQIDSQGPGKPHPLSTGNVIPDSAPGNVTTLGNLFVGEPLLPF